MCPKKNHVIKQSFAYLYILYQDNSEFPNNNLQWFIVKHTRLLHQSKLINLTNIPLNSPRKINQVNIHKRFMTSEFKKLIYFPIHVWNGHK